MTLVRPTFTLSFLRFLGLLFVVFLFVFSRQAIADEKDSTAIADSKRVNRASGVCGEVFSASCGPRDEELPPRREAMRDVYLVSEEGNKQLYADIVEWNELERKQWERGFESQSRLAQLREQLNLLQNQATLIVGVTLTKTSEKGAYCFNVLPGKYVVGTWNDFGGWIFVEVNVKAAEVQNVKLLISFMCG